MNFIDLFKKNSRKSQTLNQKIQTSIKGETSDSKTGTGETRPGRFTGEKLPHTPKVPDDQIVTVKRFDHQPLAKELVVDEERGLETTDQRTVMKELKIKKAKKIDTASKINFQNL